MGVIYKQADPDNRSQTRVNYGSSGRGFRIVLSVVLGSVAGLLMFGLGLSKLVGLAISTIVAGIALAVIKYINQGPTSA